MIKLPLDALFAGTGAGQHLNQGTRSHAQLDDVARIVDNFPGANCVFVRTWSAVEFQLTGDYALQRASAGGGLLQYRNSKAPSYWLPAAAMLRRVDPQGHILDERSAKWADFDLDSSGVTIAFANIPDAWTLDAVIWRLSDATLVSELQSLALVETQGYFLLGSHTRYDKPADLYRHLVHRYVNEDRYAWPHKRRIFSENDAHTLLLIFSGLELSTGKRIYGLLKTQLLLSVLSRQSPDGGFRHGGEHVVRKSLEEMVTRYSWYRRNYDAIASNPILKILQPIVKRFARPGEYWSDVVPPWMKN